MLFNWNAIELQVVPIDIHDLNRDWIVCNRQKNLLYSNHHHMAHQHQPRHVKIYEMLWHANGVFYDRNLAVDSLARDLIESFGRRNYLLFLASGLTTISTGKSPAGKTD